MTKPQTDKTTKPKYRNQAALEAHQFKKGQSGNPKGRPKNRVPSVISTLTSIRHTSEYWALSKEEVCDWEQAILSLNTDELQQLAQNHDVPAYAQNLAAAVLSDMQAGKINTVDKLRDRQYGVVTSKTDITTNGKDLQPEPITIEVIDRREQVEEAED